MFWAPYKNGPSHFWLKLHQTALDGDTNGDSGPAGKIISRLFWDLQELESAAKDQVLCDLQPVAAVTSSRRSGRKRNIRTTFGVEYNAVEG